jgi:hypothetical protein
MQKNASYTTPTAIGTTELPLLPFSQVFMSCVVEQGVLEVALDGLVPDGARFERDIVGRKEP